MSYFPPSAVANRASMTNRERIDLDLFWCPAEALLSMSHIVWLIDIFLVRNKFIKIQMNSIKNCGFIEQ